MNLEDQVVSLELAKKLKELGVKQESLFWWSVCPDNLICAVAAYVSPEKKERAERDFYAAYAVAELGEMLPAFIAREHLYSLQMWRRVGVKGKEHRISYWFMGDKQLHFEEADTEADARAKMLITLLRITSSPYEMSTLSQSY